MLGLAGVMVRALANRDWRVAQLDPQLLMGCLALTGGLVTAVVTHFECTGSLKDAPSCLLGGEAASLPAPTAADPHHLGEPSWRSNMQVVLTPFEVALALVALVAIDQSDLTVRALDSMARGIKALLSALSALPWIANAGSSQSRKRPPGSRGGRDARPPARPKRLKPLPPSVTRSLSRRQRYELDGLRLMREDDPVRAFRDCVKAFGWRTCHALFV